jgi:guanylate kinase
LSAPDIAPDRTSPLLILLSGPSGVGKDAALSRMRELGKPFHYTVTATTRRQRPGECDGVDYIFVTKEAFRRMIDGGELLEWAEVYGNLYGVPKGQVADALERGEDVIIKADVQGAATIRRLAPEAISIFLTPGDREELAQRLARRMTESPEALSLRLKTAEAEMEEAQTFDHVVVNREGRLDETVQEIGAVVAEEHRRGPRRTVSL